MTSEEKGETQGNIKTGTGRDGAYDMHREVSQTPGNRWLKNIGTAVLVRDVPLDTQINTLPRSHLFCNITQITNLILQHLVIIGNFQI